MIRDRNTGKQRERKRNKEREREKEKEKERELFDKLPLIVSLQEIETRSKRRLNLDLAARKVPFKGLS